jgi:CheY-like chemotaxis protein
VTNLENKPEQPIEFTKKMKEYEKITGKKAIWLNRITEGFKHWEKGGNVYTREKERIAFYVNDETKKEWETFIKTSEISSLSKLIRFSVDYYIHVNQNFPDLDSFSQFSHDLKEPLTSITGFTDLIIKRYQSTLNVEILKDLNEISTNSKILEEKINSQLQFRKASPEKEQCDILVIDDDDSTLKVLQSYFEFKKLTIRTLSKPSNFIRHVEKYSPKIILIDIMLPEKNGYDLCKDIKSHSNPEISSLPVYYITAIPGYEVEKKIEETQANGFFLKPFDFEKFDDLISNNFTD